PEYAQRRDDLRALRAALKAGLPRMVQAIATDFGHRPQHESLLAEAMPVLSTIDMMLGNLRGWMRPRRVPAGWRLWPGSAPAAWAPTTAAPVSTPSSSSCRCCGNAAAAPATCSGRRMHRWP